MLKLDNISFDLDLSSRDSAFFLNNSEDGNGLEYSFDCLFKPVEYQGEYVSPGICINAIKSTAKNVQELVGTSFKMRNIREIIEREDLFYLCEHEPLINYRLLIVEIKNDRVHIKCSGKAIIDYLLAPFETSNMNKILWKLCDLRCYILPYKISKFEIDCWLPIIEDKADWEKFGL